MCAIGRKICFVGYTCITRAGHGLYTCLCFAVAKDSSLVLFLKSADLGILCASLYIMTIIAQTMTNCSVQINLHIRISFLLREFKNQKPILEFKTFRIQERGKG